MSYTFTAGATSQSIELYIVDSTDGTPEIGVVWNTAGIDLKYRRKDAVVVSITEAALTSPALTDTWETGGFLEIGNGVYRLDLPNAAIVAGVDRVVVFGTVTGMVVLPVTIHLLGFELATATQKVDVDTIKTQAVTCGAGVTVRADVGAAAAPGAANGMFIGGTNAATTVASLSVTGQLDAGSVLIDAGMDIVGALSVNSLLIDTTTTFTGAVTMPAGLTANITGNLSGSVGTCAAATVSAIGNNVITAASLKADASAEIITALKVSTGYTAGGTSTFAEVMKINVAFAAGTWQAKSGVPGTRQILDADNGSTVIFEVASSETTPYKTVTIP